MKIEKEAVYCVFECMDDTTGNLTPVWLVKIFDQKKYAQCFIEAQQYGDYVVQEWEVIE